MSIGLEIKKLMSFFNRRKWVILIFIIVFGGAFSANAMMKPESKVTSDPNISLNREKYKGNYYSEFKFYIENKQDGRPISYGTTLKNNLLSDDQLAKMKANGIDIGYNELKNSIDIYNTNKSGDQLFLLVHSKDKEKVEKISNYFYDVFKNQDNSFLENKLVLALSAPAEITQDWKPDGIVSITTNAGLTNIDQEEKGLTEEDAAKGTETKKVGTIKKASVPQYAIIGVFLGLVVGVFVGIFMDMKSKKIQSMAYLSPLVKDDESIFDGTYFSVEDISTYMSVNKISNQKESILILAEQDEFVPSAIKDQFSHVVSHLSAENVSIDEMIYIVVKSGSTSTKWLKTEYGIIEGTSLSYQIILL